MGSGTTPPMDKADIIMRASEIGQAVHTLREHKGLLQSELGVRNATICHIERGQANLYSATALTTALKTLGCKDVPDLLNQAETVQRWAKVIDQSDQLRVELIGQGVRALRNYKDLSQSELGVGYKTVSFIENCQADKYSAKALATAIEALGCKDVPDLLRQAEPIQRWNGVIEQSDNLRTELIGNAVKTLRQHKGLLQSELGIGHMTVCHIEKGQADKYSAEVLATALEALGCKDVPDLLRQAETVQRWAKVTEQSDQVRVELIGQGVRALRQHKGLLQSGLRVGPITVSYIENGQADKYSDKALATVLESLGCKDVPDLLRQAETIQRWAKVPEQPDQSPAMIVGQAVRSLRKHKGLLQGELGIGHVTVSNIECGQVGEYSAKALTTVLEALGCKDVPDLFKQAEPLQPWTTVPEQPDQSPAMTVGQAVRNLRKHKGLTQSNLGIGHVTVSNIEHGLANQYSGQALQTVIESLGCKDVDDLLKQAEQVRYNHTDGGVAAREEARRQQGKLQSHQR